MKDIFCPLGLKNFGQRTFKYVAEVYYTLSVETARNHRTVRKYAEVIAQTVTEHLIRAEWRFPIGPFESVSVLEMQFMSYSCAARAPFPFALKARFQNIEGGVVSATVTSLIPKA